jgi:mono/diheme cytochrome c family protein/glucose/arabinose dehydrogenase/lysophospholipase L1-like esterase
MSLKIKIAICLFLISAGTIGFLIPTKPAPFEIHKNIKISLIGGNLGSRMINFDYFETEMHLRYPDSLISMRNLCDGGDTPGFRPHPSRPTPWTFPGAELFQSEFANNTGSEGHFESNDQWLKRLQTDVIITFFGFSESFGGPSKLQIYKAELEAFVKHTLAQQYNGHSAPKLALVSPIAYEDLSDSLDVPNGINENKNLLLYSQAMKEIAAKHNLLFIDAFTASKSWYAETNEPLTIDGIQLNKEGYKKLSSLLADEVFKKEPPSIERYRDMVQQAVDEKNWIWQMDFKIPNGVHVYGRRYAPFGPDNYPAEVEKIREMTAIREEAIRAATKGIKMDVAEADKRTRKLPEITTNYNPDNNGSLRYLYGDEALNSIKVAPGYKIELFASEKEFSNLANPVQMTFDNKGRLWVACMPSYPHYQPGDAKPDDKIIILEDTDNDGKADKETIFADHLHVPVGMEITNEGVYVSQGTNLILLKDTDGDDRADSREVVLSGFDDHDTHHAISAFVTDESGAIYMGEGVFLHSNVETAYGTVRATNGGFFRYAPQRKHLERTAQLHIPNPWGIAFDQWGQHFFLETSGPDARWMMPGTNLTRYGQGNHSSPSLIEEKHKVRPTSGLEFVSSRHFPDEVQGDMLINNTIGFLGTKQHSLKDSGTGYVSKHRMDLVVGEDKNFRPVDMEFAPDGSLYFIDWHNVLIGHMQHNSRDPLRDHVHGRVYRITYPSRPLVQPAKVFGASIDELLNNLKLPEYRTRYRVKRELRGRNATEVLPKVTAWVANLDKTDLQYEHHVLEALWVTWGLDKVDQVLLNRLLKSPDYHIRAAAVRVLRYTGHQVKNQAALLTQAALDKHGRVRLEAIMAASWLPREKSLPILAAAKTKPLDAWMQRPYEIALAHVNGKNFVEKKIIPEPISGLKGKDSVLFIEGKKLYAKEGYCNTCHQSNGKGLTASGFPPLVNSKWVTGSQERLIKLVLKGLMGPIEVNGVKYPGQVPMTPFGGLMNDREIAAVLTYVRNSFGNKASAVDQVKVKAVRASIATKKNLYDAAQLLKEHPLEK